MNDSGAPTDEKDMAHIYLDELQHLAAAGPAAAGANPAMADSTARALVFAESQGLSSHGLSRVPFYAGHLRAGRAIGSAVPRIVRERGGAALIDAGSGLAFPPARWPSSRPACVPASTAWPSSASPTAITSARPATTWKPWPTWAWLAWR